MLYIYLNDYKLIKKSKSHFEKFVINNLFFYNKSQMIKPYNIKSYLDIQIYIYIYILMSFKFNYILYKINKYLNFEIFIGKAQRA